jgi:putative copper resistance protein D
VDPALDAARFAHFAATMTLFGSLWFSAALAPASLVGALRTRRADIFLSALALASALCWAVGVARDMAGGDLDAQTFRDVLTDTEFGVVWQVRLAILVGLPLAALWRANRLSLALAGLAVASLALVGHAAMQSGGLGVAHRLNRAAHLLAASGWIGGLPPFLVCLIVWTRAPQRHDALTAMRRYSTFGHFAVAATLISGALDVGMTVGALPWPPLTGYRALLDLKIALVAAMVALALFNRYVASPRIARSPAWARTLGFGAAAEIVLGGLVLACVSIFATLDPNAKL